MTDKIRLNRYISDSGYCSRRQADEFIEQGRVTVNRRDCMDKGTMVDWEDRVEVDGELIRHKKRYVYIALNKPLGVTCTTDPQDRTNIVDFLNYPERIFPIGRLDKSSQGLIFMTNDGDIVNRILRAENAHEKEYVVTVDKPVTDDFLRRMSKGVRIDDGVVTRPCTATREGEMVFRIILTQGLNRQIRRMCLSLGYQVKKLQRVRIMNITLRGIPEGQWRYFTEDELRQIQESIGDSTNVHQPEAASQVSKKGAGGAGRSSSRSSRVSSPGQRGEKSERSGADKTKQSSAKRGKSSAAGAAASASGTRGAKAPKRTDNAASASGTKAPKGAGAKSAEKPKQAAPGAKRKTDGESQSREQHGSRGRSYEGGGRNSTGSGSRGKDGSGRGGRGGMGGRGGSADGGGKSAKGSSFKDFRQAGGGRRGRNR